MKPTGSRTGTDPPQTVLGRTRTPPLPAGPTGVKASHAGGDYYIVNAQAPAERQQAALLLDGDGVRGADAKEHGRGRPGGRAQRAPRTWGSAPRQGAGQRGSQAGRSAPEDTPPRFKAGCRNRVQVAIARGIHGNEAGTRLNGRVNRRWLHVRAGFQALAAQARGQVDGLRVSHPQIALFDRPAHDWKRGRNHGRLAIERGERGGDLGPHVAAQSRIDLVK